MMKFNQNQDYRASVSSTNEFLLIETYSGLGMAGCDPLFEPHLLLPDADDKQVGETILLALSNSRTLTREEYSSFFDIEKGKIQNAAWIAMLMDNYGYKTKKALFQNMKSCSIHYLNGRITIRPSYHEKLEAWSGKGIKESDYVILSVDRSPAEIGAGLRLALSRCKG